MANGDQSVRKAISTDFSVGQRVVCADPSRFISRVSKFLTGRVGVVLEVCPAVRPNAFYCGHVNRVFVLWQKKGGRGKEEQMMMIPGDLLPAEGTKSTEEGSK